MRVCTFFEIRKKTKNTGFADTRKKKPPKHRSITVNGQTTGNRYTVSITTGVQHQCLMKTLLWQNQRRGGLPRGENRRIARFLSVWVDFASNLRQTVCIIDRILCFLWETVYIIGRIRCFLWETVYIIGRILYFLWETVYIIGRILCFLWETTLLAGFCVSCERPSTLLTGFSVSCEIQTVVKENGDFRTALVADRVGCCHHTCPLLPTNL